MYSTNNTQDIGTPLPEFRRIIARRHRGLSPFPCAWSCKSLGIQIFHGLASMVYDLEDDAAIDAASTLQCCFTPPRPDHDLL